MIRTLFYVVSAGLLVWASVFVPMPLIEYAPGSATSIPPLVDISGHPTTPINGDLRLLTVRVDQPTLVETVNAWLADDHELQPRRRVIPAGIDRDVYFQAQRRQFARSFDVAVAVGLRAADLEVELRTAPIVVAVVPEGPADGTLAVGDVIQAVDGEPVTTDQALIAATQDLAEGDEVVLTVKRGGEEIEVTVEAEQIPQLERPGLGITIETVADEIDLPFEVTQEETRIGGPSAGMMIAVTVYDLVSQEDLADGRVIAGTGTVDLDGNVGPIAGIQEKVVAADEAGATVFLAPAAQATDARAVAPDHMRVVAVRTVPDAIEALRS